MSPHVRIIPFDKLRPHWQTDATCLSDQEISRANRYRFETDRVDSIVSRAALRRALATELGCKPREVTFEYGQFGKPAVSQNVHFNLSHCKSHLGIAISRVAALGVDVETVNARIEPTELAQTCFSQSECAELDTYQSTQEKLQAFFRGWTRKEAFIKALGYGLHAPLEQFDVSLDANAENSLICSRITDAATSEWRIVNIVIDEQTCGAICVNADEPSVEILNDLST